MGSFEQFFSHVTWRQNYQYGEEEDWVATSDRVSSAIADAEEKAFDVPITRARTFDILKFRRWLPGGRVLANAGTSYNNATSINCFVSGVTTPDADSIEEINAEIGRCMKILASEGGYGINANWMRPRGAIIGGTGARTPGAVEMLNMWNQTAQTLTKGPETEAQRIDAKEKIRKGAMMVTMSLWHPDVREFISAKDQEGRLTNFNMSVLASDDFMDAVRADEMWEFVFPAFEEQPDLYRDVWDGNLNKWKDAGGRVNVVDDMPARDLWETVMDSTYHNNEPGVLFVDTINRRNPLYYTEYILASNPCGEQMLPSGGACNLGNFVLPRYAVATSDGYRFRWGQFRKDIPTAVRALDNVNDLSSFPLPEQKQQAQQKRRIGLGHMGFGSLCLMLGIRYGSPVSAHLARNIQQVLANEAYAASARLAQQKEPFPEYDQEKYVEGDMFKRLDGEVQNLILRHGLRNSHLLSIQPTGNTSQIAGVVSGGLEPVFSFRQQRTAEQPHLPDDLMGPDSKYFDWATMEEGDHCGSNGGPNPDMWKAETQYRETVWRCQEDGYEDWTIHPTRGICRDVQLTDYGVMRLEERGMWDPDADWAVKTSDLSVDDHLRVMKAFAEYTDSAMSKTVNVPNDYPFEDFKDLYMDAWDGGLIKGLTTYRVGTMSAVLQDADGDDGANTGKDLEECPTCGSDDFEHSEGCKTCSNCGYEVCEL